MKSKLEQADDLLNQSVEVITFLEDLSGIGKYGYNKDEDKKYVESFFDKLEEYGELKDDMCPKCNQYPYSDTDKHCPVCFDEISDYFDDDICDVMNKYIKDGFTSKNGDLFFDDDDIVKDFNYHIEGLKKLIKMTYKKELK